VGVTDRNFSPGDRVIHIEDAAVAIVRWSKDGYSAVNWVDEDPEEFGGSVVADERLRLDTDHAD
jgi:hypothetical protein